MDKEKAPLKKVGEDIPLRSNSPQHLAEDLGQRLSGLEGLSFVNGNFRAELSLGEATYTIAPIRKNSLFETELEEIFEAPTETKVNLLVNGAARLEKRKLELPPLAERALERLEERKEIIFSALGELADKGGQLAARGMGRRGRDFALTLGLTTALAACAPFEELDTPNGDINPTEPQTSEVVPTEAEITPEPTATVATGEIPAGAPYPESAENFILNVGGSQEDIMNTLTELAPEDVNKEIAFYIAEINRMGMDPEDFNFVANIVPGRSWVVVPQHTETGRFWIPAIESPDGEDQVIQSSLHLFEYLDREVGDDFFNLVEVQNPEEYPDSRQQLVGDETGWHVIGYFNGGEDQSELVGYLNAPSDRPVVLVEPTPTPTPTPDVLSLLEQEGVVFPEDTTSELKRENYEFTVRFSEDVLSKPGLNYVKLPERIMERWFLQTMGVAMVYQSENFPEHYSRLIPVRERVEDHYESGGTLEGDPVFMDAAREMLGEGSVPVKLTFSEITGEVDSLEFNVVGEEEFKTTVEELEENDIEYVLWPLELPPNEKFRTAMYINNGSIKVFSSWQYLHKDYLSNPRRNPMFPEYALPGQTREYYYESVVNYTINWTAISIIPHLTPTWIKGRPIDIFIKYNGFLCGEDPTSNEGDCKDEANETLSPLYAPEPTPTPSP